MLRKKGFLDCSAGGLDTADDESVRTSGMGGAGGGAAGVSSVVVPDVGGK